MASPKPYRRLARPLFGLIALSSLWEGADHLLLVHSRGMSESYARYAFRDIRAFFLQPSDRRLIWSWIWGGLGCVLLLVAVASLASGGSPIASLVFAAVFISLLVVNLALGPTCRVFLTTRSGHVQLPLHRLRKARRILDQIQPRVEAAQADLIADPTAVPVTAPPLT